ncbi:hypothetical protein Tco_1132836 [Tanacetum coccineum]|uniref:Uncharacterized protein n=1 Tax=Tanacetum coccineum TaxID=301880 RepID=A0ABQ5JD27_9ASTR
MSGSEPGEMAPESSKAVVFSKFDMQIYTFELTSSELRQAVEEYCIPSDLYPRLPLYRRAVPEAMPWRHGDTDLHDDFLIGYDDHDVARLSDFLVPLRPPPGHILYVCGLTTLCRHPELRYDIKDQDKNANFREGIALILKPNPRIFAPREKKEQQSLAKAEAKRAGAGGLDEILSVTPLHQAASEVTKNPTPVVDVTQDTSYVKKEVVNLSGNTRVPTPPAATVQPSPRAEHHDTQQHAASDAHSSQSSHQGPEDELVNNQYGKDLEQKRDEWRATTSNQVEKIRRLEKDLEPKTQLLKVAEENIEGLEYEKLALLAQVAQAKADRQQLVREFIPAIVKRLQTSVEYRKSLAAPVSLCFTVGWLGGLSLGKIEEQIAQFLSEAKDLDIEGSKS